MYDQGVDPVTVQATAMSVRATLAATLLSFALPAFAHDAGSPGVGGDGSSCTSDYAISASPDPDPVRSGKRTDADRPAIPRGAASDPSPVRQPRWHSFLPGMFR